MLDYIDSIDAPYAYVESGDAIRDAQRLLAEPGPYAYLLMKMDRVISTGKSPSILQLRGLGCDVWAGVSADTYLRALRNEWPSGE
jgi:hypothetical protein